MGGRLIDYIAQGLAAARPDATDMPARIAAGAGAIYYAYDTSVFSFFNSNAVAWDELDVSALTGLFSDLTDVDWSTPPTDGQIFEWDTTSGKLIPVNKPTAGLDAEQVRDTVAAFVINGAGITVTHLDGADTLEIASNVTQYTNEMAMDAIAAMIAAGTHVRIGVVYDDVTNSLSFTGTVTQYTNADADARIAAASIGDLADVDLTGAADGEVLTRVAGVWEAAAPAGGGSDPWTYVKLGADFVTNSGSAVDVTGLAFAPAANKVYEIKGMFLTRTASTGVGPRPGLTWPAGVTDGVASLYETSGGSGVADVVAHGTSGGAVLIGVGALPSLTSWPGRLHATMVTGPAPSGNFQIQLASETAGTNVTFRAGSWIAYREI